MYHRHAGNRADRVALMGMVSTSFSFVLALVKIGIGVWTSSLWLLIFGGYYVVLAIARSLFLQHYSRSRRKNEVLAAQQFVRAGGFAYVLLGTAFTACAYIMFRGGYQTHFSRIAAITVATMGFYKITLAIVGFIRARRSAHGPLVFLKAMSLADGAMAIVLTQYALLSMESQAVNQVTGLFGMAVGTVIALVGVAALIVQKVKWSH
ncbi:hypothetical protein [Schleiferilactobacillus perolens]|uniref:Uncharacterized protein n=1 Tax=Schleiferilactobacillus perolens DSM 12744 TaxID=1423792 RepID=A0A0R1MX38_9LACO|nr:hypothetical protein [Schleiferilactobacillus perolens]KRL12736.1 hypothetical protein FD09_GL002718 [Schleiferilactobacillus perolens DSM 12744]